MADWGLYSALRGTDDWQTKRDDKKMNLLAAEKMEQRQQKKVAESAAAEADIAKYMQELQNMEVLPEDQERVSQAEKQARQKIVAGIAKSNGDLRQYMSTGGITALNDYKTNVMQSEAVKQAGVNKVNLTNYLKQEEKGNQRHKLVDVTVPLFEADGQTPQVDADGNQLTETKKMSWQDQYDLYKKGVIKQLNYNGSEKKIDVRIEDFNKMYKNPANPYQKDNYVTQSDIYDKYISKGASKEYAKEQAQIYVDAYNAGGDAWRWNAGDPYELAMKMAKLDAYKKAQAAKSGKGGLTSSATMNMISTIQRLGESDGQGGQYADTRKAGRKEIESVAYQLPGFTTKKDEEGNKLEGQYSFNGNFSDIKAFGPEFMDPNGKETNALDLSQAENIQPTGFYAKLDDKGNKRYYMLANVEYDDATQGWSQLNPMNLASGSWSDKGEGVPETRTGRMKDYWQRNDARGTVMGEAAIDITDQIKSKEIGMQINSYMNYDLNQEMTPSTATDQDYLNPSNKVDKALLDAGISNDEWQNWLVENSK